MDATDSPAKARDRLGRGGQRGPSPG